MLRILKTQLISNLADRFTVIKHSVFGYIHQFDLNVFLCGFACFFFNQITKIICRKMQLTRAISYRRQTYFFWFFGREIAVQ